MKKNISIDNNTLTEKVNLSQKFIRNIVKNCKESDIILCYCRTYQRMDKKLGINPISYRIDVCLSYINIIPQNKKFCRKTAKTFVKLRCYVI